MAAPVIISISDDKDSVEYVQDICDPHFFYCTGLLRTTTDVDRECLLLKIEGTLVANSECLTTACLLLTEHEVEGQLCHNGSYFKFLTGCAVREILGGVVLKIWSADKEYQFSLQGGDTEPNTPRSEIEPPNELSFSGRRGMVLLFLVERSPVQFSVNFDDPNEQFGFQVDTDLQCPTPYAEAQNYLVLFLERDGIQEQVDVSHYSCQLTYDWSFPALDRHYFPSQPKSVMIKERSGDDDGQCWHIILGFHQSENVLTYEVQSM